MEHRNEDLALIDSTVSHVCKLLLETDEGLKIEIGGLNFGAHILKINLLNQLFDVVPFDLWEVLPNLKIV